MLQIYDFFMERTIVFRRKYSFVDKIFRLLSDLTLKLAYSAANGILFGIREFWAISQTAEYQQVDTGAVFRPPISVILACKMRHIGEQNASYWCAVCVILPAR